ncbi:hypothetical protein [Limnothrix sp. PR1529]|uniref:hypothetical protein n=1 Tax=Limnothrix sp. PR1529 TaxID=1704291 RepID=UPI001179BF09|nr:hypothetical protein [Limnothrix sp. PR1529]
MIRYKKGVVTQLAGLPTGRGSSVTVHRRAIGWGDAIARLPLPCRLCHHYVVNKLDPRERPSERPLV